MTDWNEAALADAASWLSGGTPKTSEESYWGGDIPWISAASLRNFYIHDSDRNVTELGANNGTRLVPNDTILFVVRGMSLKTEFRMGISCRTVAFGQDCKALTPRPGIDPLFLAYAIKARAPEILGLVDEAGHGTGRLQTELLGNLQVRYPNAIDEQRRTIAPLQALDDKIAINERIAATADALSAASYAATFLGSPGEFTDHPLTRSAQFINGRAFTKNATGTGRMVVRIAEVNSGPGASTVYNDLEVPEKHLACPGDILFAWSGSLTVARWYRPESIINQHIFKVVPNKGVPAWLAFRLVKLRLDKFRAIAADKATTMGHIQRRHLDEVVPTPSPTMLEKLDAQLRPLWERALAAEKESLALAALREDLLPQLMSGKLRVRDAERIVEDAV